ncbi:MAG: SCO7613 C-terminal domain-containing membrane protein [Cellulomonas sp.]
MPPPSTSSATPYTVVRRLLTDAALCPDCAAVLTRSRCDACGLDLSGAPGQQLWDLSQHAADALTRRDGHLQAMRAHQATSAAAQRQMIAPPPTARVAIGYPPSRMPLAGERTGAPARIVVSGSSLAPARPPVRTGGPLGARAPRRQWRVQTVLQVLGASLLAAASIVFLIFSWGWIGLTGRAVTVAVGTVVVFVLADRLRRAALGSSAEAIGALGAVMLLLDAWAVPATGLLRVTMEPMYAAAACVVCAALLLAGGRATHLRVTRVVGTALLPLAPVLLVPLASSPSVAAWLLVASVVLACGRFGLPRSSSTGVPDVELAWFEPAVLTGAAWLMTTAGTFLAVGGVIRHPVTDGPGGVGALGALAGLAAMQVWLVHTAHPADVRTETANRSWWTIADSAVWWGAAAGSLTAAAGGAAAAVAGARLDAPGGWFLALVPCGGAAAAALVFAAGASARRSLSADPTRRPDLPGGQSMTRGADAAADSSVVVALFLGAPAVVALPFAAALASIQPGVENHEVLALGTLAGAAVVAALLWLAVRPSAAARAGRKSAVWLSAAVVLSAPAAAGAAVPPLGRTGTVALFLLTGAVTYGADRRLSGSHLGHRLLRAPLRVASGLAVPGALVATHGSRWLVAVTLAALGALAVGARLWLVGRPRGRATVAGVAVVATWGAVLVGLTAAGVRSPLAGLLAAGMGLVLVTPAALSHETRWRRVDRCTTLATVGALAAAGWAAGFAAWGRPGQASALAPLLVLVGVLASIAVVGVLVGGLEALGDRARRVAGRLFAPVGVSAVVSLYLGLGAQDVRELAAGIAAVGAIGVLVALPVASARVAPHRAPDPMLRLILEITGWLAQCVALGVALAGAPGVLALVLLVGAITAGAWSLRPDRRTARWGVIVLGTAASWVLLNAGDVGTPEAYLAPAGLVLAAVGARRRRGGAPADAPLLAAGLALVLVPTALLDGIVAGVPRVGLTLAASALVVVIGTRLRAPAPPENRTATPLTAIDATHVLLLIGLLVLVLGPARHALNAAIVMIDASAPRPPAFGLVRVEVWSGAAALVMATATIRLVRVWTWVRYSPRTWGWWLVAAVTAAPSLVAADSTPAGFVRWTVPLAIGAALAVAGARTHDRPPLAPGQRAALGDAAVRADRTTLIVLGLTLATASALVAVLRSPLPADVPIAILGAVVTAAGAARWRRMAVAAPWVTAPWLTSPWPLAGPLLLLPAAIDQEGAWRTPTVFAAALVLVAVGLRLRRPTPSASETAESAAEGTGIATRRVVDRARELLLVGGVMMAASGPGLRGTLSAVRGPDPARLLAVEAWTLPAAAVIGVAVLALVRARPDVPRARKADPRRWGLAVVLAAVAAPTLLAVDGSTTGLTRALAAMVVGAWLAIAGTLSAGGARRDLGLCLAGAAALAWTLRDGPEPADLPIVVTGCLLLVVGALAMAAVRERSSWRGLGPGLALLLVVPLATGWADPTAWRLLLVLVGAVTAVLAGAVRRWQAPFTIGGAVLIVLALVQLSPAAAGALRVVEWWMLLAVGGAVLLGLGLTYERRLREAKEAVRFIVAMR